MKQIIRFERPTKKIEIILPDEGELEDLSFEDIWINPLDNLEEVSKSSKPQVPIKKRDTECGKNNIKTKGVRQLRFKNPYLL